MRLFILLLGWLLPHGLRKALYAKAFGWKLAKTSRLGRSLIFCKHLSLGEDASIGSLNVVRYIDFLIVHDHSDIGSLNWITGFPTTGETPFPEVKDRRCGLELRPHSSIISRHFIDCTGGVTIGAFSTIAGLRSQILTHSIDIYSSHQTCYPILIGDYCFVGTGSILLPGSGLPNYSILGAGSVLTQKQNQEYALYAGSPATMKKDLSQVEVKYFTRTIGRVW